MCICVHVLDLRLGHKPIMHVLVTVTALNTCMRESTCRTFYRIVGSYLDIPDMLLALSCMVVLNRDFSRKQKFDQGTL